MASQVMISRRRDSHRGSLAWWVSLASTVVLLFNVRYGTQAVAVFIGVWGVYALAWPGYAADALLRTRLPWAFPLFALASVLWSMAPDLTARLAVEWLLTTGIAVLMARSLTADRFLTAWMCALVPVVIIGGLTGDSQYTETLEVAATGIFGSKNNFALHICLLLFVSFAVLTDPQQKKLFRAVALLGAAVGPLLLWRAKSVGALVVFFPSLVLMFAIIGLGRISTRLRQIALVGAIATVVGIAAIVTPVAISSQETLLSLVGKTGNLTGRGYLWYRAEFLIQQRPTLGVGYSAFWVQGNPEAEGLWRAEHIAARRGFHFHNFYYETLVELGYVGMAIGGAVFALTGIATLLWGIRQPGPQSGFFCALMLFLFMRSFVELDLTGGFGLTALVIPAAWLYATSALGSLGRARNRWMTTGPASIGPRLAR